MKHGSEYYLRCSEMCKGAENVQELLEIIDKAVTYLQELDDKQTGIEYFETFMRYIFSTVRNLTREDTDEITKESEFVMKIGKLKK